MLMRHLDSRPVLGGTHRLDLCYDPVSDRLWRFLVQVTPDLFGEPSEEVVMATDDIMVMIDELAHRQARRSRAAYEAL